MCFGCSKELSHRNTSFECLKHNFTIEGKQPKPRFGCLKGPSHHDGSFKHTNRIFSEIKKKSYQPKKHTTSGHQRPASDMPSQWPIAGGLLMARRRVLAGMETPWHKGEKRRQYFVSKYGSSIYI